MRPEMWARTEAPLSSRTRNMGLGRGSVTSPSSSIASSLTFATTASLRGGRRGPARTRAESVPRPAGAREALLGTPLDQLDSVAVGIADEADLWAAGIGGVWRTLGLDAGGRQPGKLVPH